MKIRSISSFLTCAIIILKLFHNLQCAYRQNAYKIFDKYTLLDLVFDI